MNFLNRFGDRHERKEKKMPDRSQSVDPTSTPLSPDSNPRPRRLDNPSTSPSTAAKEPDWVVADDIESEAAASSHPHGSKRRTVSISRSGRYKSRSKGRSRILSDDVYSGTTVPIACSPTRPSPTAQPPPPSSQPQPPKKDLVKPSARDKSPARPYIILKTDTAVNFAIESTTL